MSLSMFIRRTLNGDTMTTDAHLEIVRRRDASWDNRPLIGLRSDADPLSLIGHGLIR
jgi:hypothetical protein